MNKHVKDMPPQEPASETASAVSLPWERLAGAFLAGIPFWCTLPYTVHSWRSSPMDRLNWIFFLAFLLVAACGTPAIMDSVKQRKLDWFALLAAAAAAVLYATGVMKQIYMIRIMAGTWFWWTGIWFFCGWKAAWGTIPAFGALSLGCTSTTFLMCRHLLIQPQTALFLKLGAAVLCAAVCAVLILTDYVMKREVFWFLLAAGAILTGTLVSRGAGKTAAAFKPDLTAAVEGFTMTETPLTEDSIRFFEGATVHQYAITDGVFRASILEVKCGNDIHKIHPASHCLRSSGAEILSESVVMHTMPDGRGLPVTEIRSRIHGTPILTFVWYTGPEETIGSFYTFRRKWSPSEQWYSYQIVTEVYDGREDSARKFLLDLLSKY
ncbi:MAG: hypothetical protein IKC53_07695 [Lentisphaeria bacterium]|nr:hypothetical protein [Lentisphaeria bacterium]